MGNGDATTAGDNKQRPLVEDPETNAEGFGSRRISLLQFGSGARRPRLKQFAAQDAGQAEDGRSEQQDAAWFRGRSGAGPLPAQDRERLRWQGANGIVRRLRRPTILIPVNRIAGIYDTVLQIQPVGPRVQVEAGEGGRFVANVVADGVLKTAARREPQCLVEVGSAAEFARSDRDLSRLQNVAREQPRGEGNAVDRRWGTDDERITDGEAEIDGPAEFLSVGRSVVIDVVLG